MLCTMSLWLLDINECLTNNGGCSIDAQCTNTIGSFLCTCNAGFSGNGSICTGKVGTADF